jgi:hypothetical protein
MTFGLRHQPLNIFSLDSICCHDLLCHLASARRGGAFRTWPPKCCLGNSSPRLDRSLILYARRLSRPAPRDHRGGAAILCDHELGREADFRVPGHTCDTRRLHLPFRPGLIASLPRVNETKALGTVVFTI